jgi:hypothetical protein
MVAAAHTGIITVASTVAHRWRAGEERAGRFMDEKKNDRSPIHWPRMLVSGQGFRIRNNPRSFSYAGPVARPAVARLCYTVSIMFACFVLLLGGVPGRFDGRGAWPWRKPA